MKLPRRVVYSVLAALVFLSLLLRYPRTAHEVGVDSFFIHNLATNIVNDGYAEWILNPLSWFGWYPLSYPSGGPFLIASFSSMSSLAIEPAILLLSLTFGTLGILTSFVMAREFRDDDLFSLGVAFIYAFAPRYLAFTLWTASMRSLFMVLLPVFIWVVIRTYREPKVTDFALVTLFFLILAATHRLAALLAVVMIAFVVAILLLIALRILRLRFPKIVLASPYRRVSPYLALGCFAGVAGIMFLGTDVLAEYSTGELLSGTSLHIQMFNFGVSLTRSVGLSLLFALVGVFVLVRSRNKSLREPFLLISFLGLTPTLFLRQYTGFYILPFIALLAGFMFVAAEGMRRPRFRKAVIITMLAASLGFSAAVLEYEIQNTTFLPEATYGTSIYLRTYAPERNLITNDGLLGIRVASFSASRILPVGGAGTTFQSPELLAYRFFTRAEVEANTVRVPLQDLTLESDSPWIASTIQAEADWVDIMQGPFDSQGSAMARYDPAFYLENEHLAGFFFAYGNRYPSEFASSVHDSAYKLYDGDAETLWYVAAPRSD